KGIILAGGSGTRLYPMTIPTNKQLLPVYDKPMIYYPLSTLMLAGIRDILIISTREGQPQFQALLKDGSQWGIHIQYATQDQPNGIAQAFIIGEDFIGTDSVSLILGDNILFGQELSTTFPSTKNFVGATVFGYHVKDPERYGVLKLDAQKNVVDILEKPAVAPSNFAVTGLYFYDNQVINIAKQLKPSARGELEITDVNRVYLQRKQLNVKLFKRGTAWLDTGTFESLLDAAYFMRTLEHRQALKIGCPEEIAWRNKFISAEQLKNLAQPLLKSGYGQYLLDILHEGY
ncbi:MAG: glucose-1-phosphate thymidylyltransferase, partial [Gammaproteobacteria bacterium RIFCSPLOWO2_02_FULL_42_9]